MCEWPQQPARAASARRSDGEIRVRHARSHALLARSSLTLCPLSPLCCSQKPLLPRFYSHAYTYFLVVVIVLGLQFTAGFLYLWKFGLQDAVDEGAEQIRQEALGRQARQEREALIEDPRNV